MSSAEAALAAAAVLLAGVVHGMTGFGFALLAAPVLIALLAPVSAVSAMALLALLVNALTLVAERRVPEILRPEATVLLGWAAAGLPIGALLLDRLPADAIRVGVGALVLGTLAQRTTGSRPRCAPPASGAGLLAGALTTTTGLNGPPLVLRLTAIEVPPRARRDTLAALFLALGGLGAATLAFTGQLRPPDGLLPLGVAAGAGALLGRRAAARLSANVDSRLVNALLAATGLAALVSGLNWD